MTVRRKTLFIIAITCLGLVIVLNFASRSFLLGGFIKLEQASAGENVQGVLNALDQDLATTDRFTYDRAAADETDHSMVSPATELIHEGLCQDGTQKSAVPLCTGSLYKSIRCSVILRRSRAFDDRRNLGLHRRAIITTGMMGGTDAKA